MIDWFLTCFVWCGAQEKYEAEEKEEDRRTGGGWGRRNWGEGGMMRRRMKYGRPEGRMDERMDGQTDFNRWAGLGG